MLMGSLVLLALSVPPAHAAKEAAAAPAVEMRGGFPVTSAKRLFPLEKLARGMRGVGYTVFSGAELKTFDVEILGLLENMLGTGRPVILARLSGADIEFTGVIAGMSGSPVYLDGLLLGAVSYRFGAFSKEPIAGITPIQSMLDTFGDEVEPGPDVARTAALPALPPLRSRADPGPLALPPPRAAGGPFEARPIDTPITASGLLPEVLRELERALGGAGFVVAGGGAGPRKLAERKNGRRQLVANRPGRSGLNPAAPIAPGAPIAALLMTGDISIAGTGTVSFLDGEVVLAFGHPFFGWGHVAFPMATSAIIHTLATPLGSYKMGSAADEVGAITHDRLTAIGGKLGQAAPMVVARLALTQHDAAERAARRTEVEIVPDPVWLPSMLELALNNTVAGRLGFESGGTIDLRARIEVEDRTLEVVDSYSAPHPARVGAVMARDLSTVLAVIARNSVVPVNIRAVSAELSTRRAVELAVIEQVTPAKTVVRAGEVLALEVRIRPYRQEPVLARMQVPIPADMLGDVELFVGGGIEMDRRVQDLTGDRVPTTLDELLALLGERRAARALFARVFTARPGVRVDSEILSSLPPAERAVLGAAAARNQKPLSEAMGPELQVPYGDVLLGGLPVALTVTP